MYENKTTKNNKGTTFSGKVYRKVAYVSVRKTLRYVKHVSSVKEKQNSVHTFLYTWKELETVTSSQFLPKAMISFVKGQKKSESNYNILWYNLITKRSQHQQWGK